MYDVSADGVTRREVDAAALGLRSAATSELRGGDAAENAAIIESVLDGAAGPRRDVVLLNAGAALLAAGCVEELRDGVELSAATIDDGRARALVDRLRVPRAAAAAPTPATVA
jgi:anthranilate phosphoribosyltransferase